MSLPRSALAMLALFAALPHNEVEAADGRAKFHAHRSRHHERTIRVDVTPNGQLSWMSASLPGSDTATASVVVTLSSDGGEEDLDLVESDAWLHGAATISALPKDEATVEVRLYGEGGTSLLATLTGTLDADGNVGLTASQAEACTKGEGCDDATSDPEAYDVEVLAADLFLAKGGYDLSLDLSGVDTYAIAYGEVIVTEGSVEKAYEIGWDEIGSVWEAAVTLPHSGLVQITGKAYDAAGKKLHSSKAKLGVAWGDSADGATALATDEDPLTSVGFHRSWPRNRYSNALDYTYSAVGRNNRSRNGLMTVVSEGWGSASSVPSHAQLELTNGGTVSVPANSYQKRAGKGSYWAVYCAREYSYSGFVPLNVTVGTTSFGDIAYEQLETPICAGGTCIVLTENDDGTCNLTASAYASDAGKLPSSVELVVSEIDEKGNTLPSEKLLVDLDDEIIAVFSNEVDFAQDPSHLDLAGKVSLLAAPNSKGKQSTLAKGKFYATFSRDADGDLTLAGADKDVVSSRGDVVVAGKSLAFELTDTDKDGQVEPPPVAASTHFDRFGEGWARVSMVSRL